MQLCNLNLEPAFASDTVPSTILCSAINVSIIIKMKSASWPWWWFLLSGAFQTPRDSITFGNAYYSIRFRSGGSSSSAGIACCARHTCQLDSHYIAGDSVASLETLREVGETLHHFSIERTIILKVKTSFNVPCPMLCLTKSTSVLTKQAKRIDKKERKMNNRAYNLS